MTDVVWRGPEELRPLLVPIDSVQRHPRNPRRGDVALIAQSLELYGQTRPIVVWRQEPLAGIEDAAALGTELFIVAGNHTWQGAKRIGWTHIAAVSDPAMSESDATNFLLADNAAADKATYDDAALVASLQRLYDQGRLAGTGFSIDDLDDMIAEANRHTANVREFDAGRQDDEDDAGGGAADDPKVKQLLLGYEAEHYRLFAVAVQSLEKAYGTQGVTATVTEALTREFAKAWAE